MTMYFGQDFLKYFPCWSTFIEHSKLLEFPDISRQPMADDGLYLVGERKLEKEMLVRKFGVAFS